MPETFRILADLPQPAPTGEHPTSEIQIAKQGSFRDERYGRFAITAKDFDAWVRNFAAVSGGRLLVDFDHSPEKFGTTEAAGWITQLVEKGRELWAKVEWTSLGAEAVRDRRYLFISPSFTANYKDETGKRHGAALLGVGLTNRPFLDGMAAVSLSKAAFASEEEASGEVGEPSDSRAQMPGLTKIAQALGLDAEADEAKILEAVAALPSLAKVLEALKLDEDADEATVLEAIGELGQTDDEPAERKTLDQLAKDEGKVVLDATTFDQLKQGAAKGVEAAEELRVGKFDTAFAKVLDEGRVDAKDETKALWRKQYDATGEDAIALLDALPKVVSTAPQGSGAGGGGEVPEGVDPERHDLHRRVQAHMAEHSESDYAKALDAVVAQEAVTA